MQKQKKGHPHDDESGDTSNIVLVPNYAVKHLSKLFQSTPSFSLSTDFKIIQDYFKQNVESFKIEKTVLFEDVPVKKKSYPYLITDDKTWSATSFFGRNKRSTPTGCSRSRSQRTLARIASRTLLPADFDFRHIGCLDFRSFNLRHFRFGVLKIPKLFYKCPIFGIPKICYE